MINKNKLMKSIFNKNNKSANNRIIKFEMRQKLQTKEV